MKKKILTQQYIGPGLFLSFAPALFFVAFFCCASGTSSYAANMNPEKRTCEYVMSLEGKKIGETVVSKKRSTDSAPDLMRTETKTTLQVKGFWGAWALDAKSIVNHDHSGVIDFDHKITENKNRWHLFGKQYKQALWCSARKVQTEKEQEDDEIVDLAGYIVTQTVPYAGDALMVLNLLGDDDDEQGDVAVPLDRFDTTMCELPAYLLKLPEKEENRFRILDTSELEIESVAVTRKGNEKIVWAGRKFACRVFLVEAKKSQSTYWIAEDTLGAFIVREKGEDSDGVFEINLFRYDNDGS